MGLCDTVDPMGGSYYMETLTNQMRDKIAQIMAEVDAGGGIVKMISEGTIQAQVSAQAYDMYLKIQSGEFPKVGVNCYRIEEQAREVEFHPYKPEDAERQIKSLNAVRAERDQAQVDRTLARVKADAQAGANVMPAIMEAVKAYASVGEITSKLVEVYGCYQEPIRF